ncbi:unnamed protein product [Euphydryas editha]|uniref:Uncharacterized protein n=1 Tax=Euphydryas editha TaxID=104508 RepID=A0AAU9U9Z3_EUPED|nr:unnamed protein product [Euphydryas editha]
MRGVERRRERTERGVDFFDSVRDTQVVKCNRASVFVHRSASGRRAAAASGAEPGAGRAVPTGAPWRAHASTADTTNARRDSRHDRDPARLRPRSLAGGEWTVQCSVPVRESRRRSAAACGERSSERAAGAPRLADPMRPRAPRHAPLLLALALACCLQVRPSPTASSSYTTQPDARPRATPVRDF